MARPKDVSKKSDSPSSPYTDDEITLSDVAIGSHRIHESLSVHLISAPLPKRVMAYIVDLGILMTVSYLAIALFAFLFLAGSFGATLLPAVVETYAELIRDYGTFIVILLLLLLVVALLLLVDLYFVILESKTGTTLGKKLFGLSVIGIQTGKITFGQAALRSFLRIIDCYLVVPGLISILMTKRSQRLGDLFASTLVIYSKTLETSKDHLYLNQEQFNPLYESLSLKPMPVSLEREFLHDIFYKLILNRPSEGSKSIGQWAEIFAPYVPQGDLTPDTYVRFIAEMIYLKGLRK